MLRAAENGHVQTARWLYETKGFEIDEEQRPTFIQHALRVGDLEFADLFLPTDGTKWVLLEYDNMRPSPALIEWMLDLGYLTWDLHLAGSAIRDLADYGSLSLMQQIFTLHSPLQKDDDRLPEYWMEASVRACRGGQLETLQWLISNESRFHPHYRKSRMYCKNFKQLDNLLSAAAGGGYINVDSYLRDQGAVDRDGSAIAAAVLHGHTTIVQWLLEKYSYLTHSAKRKSRLVVYEAVTRGHIEILKLLQRSDSSGEGRKCQWKWLGCIKKRYREARSFMGSLGRTRMVFH